MSHPLVAPAAAGSATAAALAAAAAPALAAAPSCGQAATLLCLLRAGRATSKLLADAEAELGQANGVWQRRLDEAQGEWGRQVAELEASWEKRAGAAMRDAEARLVDETREWERRLRDCEAGWRSKLAECESTWGEQAQVGGCASGGTGKSHPTPFPIACFPTALAFAVGHLAQRARVRSHAPRPALRPGAAAVGARPLRLGALARAPAGGPGRSAHGGGHGPAQERGGAAGRGGWQGGRREGWAREVGEALGFSSTSVLGVHRSCV